MNLGFFQIFIPLLLVPTKASHWHLSGVCWTPIQFGFLRRYKPFFKKIPVGASGVHAERYSRPKSGKKQKSGTQADLENYLKAAKLLNLPQAEVDAYVASFNILKTKAAQRGNSDASLGITSPKKVPKLTKRLLQHQALLPEKGVECGLDDAISRIRLISKTRFVEGIDIALVIPPTRTRLKSQAAQFAKLVTLPHPSIKSSRMKLGVFAKPDTCELLGKFACQKLAFTGGSELLDEIASSGELPNVNLVFSDVETFPKLSKIGKLLSKGKLMPSGAIGTCFETATDLVEAVESCLQRNIAVVRSDSAGDIKCSIADVRMQPHEIRENLLELVAFLNKNRPPYASSSFITKAFLSSSMGPSFKLSLLELGVAKAKRRT